MPARQPRQPHLKEVPRSRAKSTKPKFDIDVEPIAQPEAPSATWVYRADPIPVETLRVEPVAAPTHQAKAATPESIQPDDNPFLMVGEGLLLISLGTMKLAYYAARGLIVAPIRLASKLLT